MDSQSRLLSIQNPLNERTTMQWDALDREQHRVLGNGGAISHTWDVAGRETLIENRDKNGVGQFIATNTYSPVDNRLTALEMDGTRATYWYDASSQIVSEARGGTMAYARSYVWDALGNRLQQYDSGVLTQSTFNKANQLLVSTPASGPATTTSYDAAGNTIGINTGGALTTQVWSPENRLLSYADAQDNSEQNLYSDDGLRKKRVKGAVTTLFTYDETALLLETNTSNVVQARYTNSPETWGGLASQNRSGVSSFYGIDSQQCARILVSSAGLITDSYSWKVFGEPIQSGSGTINPYGYVALALYYAEFADLLNAWNRWVKPSIGRWDSRDSLGFDGGDWNPMRFVRNNPLSRTDPTGMFSLSCFKSCEEEIGEVIEKGSGGNPVKWICNLAAIMCLLFPDPESPACVVHELCDHKENVEKCVKAITAAFCASICQGGPGDCGDNRCASPCKTGTCRGNCPSLRSCLMCCSAGSWGNTTDTNLCLVQCCSKWSDPFNPVKGQDLCDIFM